MREELVRIHARLCGDGCICYHETSEKDRNRRARIVYSNKVEENLVEFRDDMREVFDVKMNRHRNEVRVKSVRIADELTERFGFLNSDSWRVSPSIFGTSNDKRLDWLRAFIRDEGYYEEEYSRLKIKSMNKKGLEDVMELFASIGVEANITGPNCDDSFYLAVYDIERFPDIHEIARKKPKVR